MVTERSKHGLTRRPFRDRRDQRRLEVLHLVVEEVFLVREVVEDGALRDIGRPRYLRDRDRLESALGEEVPRGLGDQLASLLLFPLTEPGRRRHTGQPTGR